MKFVFTNDPGTLGKEHIPERKYLPKGAEVVIADYLPEGDNEEFYRKLEDADAVLNSYVYLGKKEIDAMKKCKCISFQSTGYNEVDLDYAAEKGIPVTSILDYCTQETAENAIAMMLCLQRSTLEYNRLIQEDHVWNVKAILHQQRVEGQVMGIVGLGRIGRHVAKIAGAGLGMKILAYDPYVSRETAATVGAELVELDRLLAEADVVSIHMSLTDSNHNMFNRELFQKMKKRPLLINEGRGQMVSEQDLAWALDEGLVRGAGLDMLESEFPDEEYLRASPLVGRKNVILNPHSGYQSDTSLELIYKISMENAIKCLEGRYEDCWVIRNGVGIGGVYIR